jgi:nitrile hydratase
MENGNKAVAELGISMEADHLIAVENTPDVHNLIVCTLCSCYPRSLLGMPPTWYKSRNYRSRVVHEPRSVLSEFGTEISNDTTVRVHDSNADMRYVVLPMRPKGTEDWTEEQLEELLSRDHLVGVTVPVMDEA